MSDIKPDPHHHAGNDLLYLTLQRVESKVDDALTRIGKCWNDEDGRLKGTGLAGDFARLEKRVDERFRRDDNMLLSWRSRAAGAMAASALFAGGLWWAIRQWLETLK